MYERVGVSLVEGRKKCRDVFSVSLRSFLRKRRYGTSHRMNITQRIVLVFAQTILDMMANFL